MVLGDVRLASLNLYPRAIIACPYITRDTQLREPTIFRLEVDIAINQSRMERPHPEAGCCLQCL